MNSSLNYIDDYFTGVLNTDEKAVFEQRCLSDHAFAKEVAEYISIRDGVRAHLQQQKKNEFAQLCQELMASQKPARIVVFKRIAYLAAACVLLFTGWFTLLKPASSQKIADTYISGHLNTLGLNMGGTDSLQAGITAYNSGSYAVAENLFKPLINKPETAPEAIKYLGITYLAMKQYDAALKNFNTLSAMSLYTNPGKLYMALTLMARSTGTDQQRAKEILQEIITKNLYGNQEARIWIKQL
jgi:tetratricopeptide (TPR) repeat protein